jgi:hypothetical protein
MPLRPGEHRRFHSFARGRLDAWEPKVFAQTRVVDRHQAGFRLGIAPEIGGDLPQLLCSISGCGGRSRRSPRRPCRFCQYTTTYHLRAVGCRSPHATRPRGLHLARRPRYRKISAPKGRRLCPQSPRPAKVGHETRRNHRYGCLVLQSACTIKSGTAIMIQLKRLDTKSSRAFGPKMTGG